MAFVPEDGTGLPGANSLVTLDYYKTYLTDRGRTDILNKGDSALQVSLISGTSYANTQYAYKGQKLNPNQGCAFPRVGVTDPSGQVPQGVPDCVKQVVCELGIRATAGPLIPDPVVDAGGRPVKMIQKRVGPLHKTVEYAGPGEYVEMARYPAVDGLMCPWLVYADQTYKNGVKVAGADVNGVSNSTIAAVSENSDRYTGPMNENYEDVGNTDGNSPF